MNNNAITLLFISIGLFFVFTNGQYKDVKKLHILAGEYQKVLQRVADIVVLRDNLLEEYGTMPAEELDRMSKVLPDNIDNVRLALDLDNMASSFGISIKNIQTTSDSSQDAETIVLPEYDKPYDKATVSFGFIATHENCMRFLAEIERNLRVMDVTSITFQTGDSDFYEYQVSVDTYWLK